MQRYGLLFFILCNSILSNAMEPSNDVIQSKPKVVRGVITFLLQTQERGLCLYDASHTCLKKIPYQGSRILNPEIRKECEKDFDLSSLRRLEDHTQEQYLARLLDTARGQ